MAIEEKIRIDKWLWAARFFKTRSLASRAVSGGHVHANGQRIKPSRIVQVGDTLEIRRGLTELVIVVEGLSGRRGPATAARTLYRETEESVKKREMQAGQRRLANMAAAGPVRRPDKRERRKIRKFIRKD
ncbi:MAG: S4 domain-containing protein [Desulfobulbaceae bacterium]|nr:S4 domain-containing protein [Desulfobulbaceae bacterium]